MAAAGKIAVQTLYRGETLRLLLPVVTPDGDAKDFTGATIRWGLLTSAGAPVIPEKSLGDGVAFQDGDPTLGRVLVTVSADETEDIVPAIYTQEWHMTDAINDVQVYRGLVSVASAVLWSTS
jgi:hypothetical protein